MPKHTKRNKSAKKNKTHRRGTRRQGGGYSPISSGFGGKLNPYPPGGPYKVGASTNGLDGGFYYSYNQNPTLQTRILGMEDNVGFLKASGQTLAPGAKDYSTLRGGVKKRRRNTKRYSRMTKRKRGRTSKRRKRRNRNSKRRQRRNKKGGSGLKSLIPSDVIDTTRQTEYGVKSLYDGLTAQRLGVNPSVMSQPISRNFH